MDLNTYIRKLPLVFFNVNMLVVEPYIYMCLDVIINISYRYDSTTKLLKKYIA